MDVDNQDLLRRLIAERAMYDSFCRMFRLVDGRDYERVGPECFVEDALIEYDLTPDKRPDSVMRFEGRDALTRYLIDVTQHQMQHHAHVIGQVVYDWNGPRPILSANVFALHWFRAAAARGDTRPADWIALGTVTDQFEERDGRWLIARRMVRSAGGSVVTGSLPGA